MEDRKMGGGRGRWRVVSDFSLIDAGEQPTYLFMVFGEPDMGTRC
jgi:hypothetical protein